MNMVKKLHPVHPGEVLLEEFLKPMNLSQNRLAIEIGVDGRRINESCWVIAASRPIRPCVWDATLEYRLDTGLAYRQNMIWMSPWICWVTGWIMKSDLAKGCQFHKYINKRTTIRLSFNWRIEPSRVQTLKVSKTLGSCDPISSPIPIPFPLHPCAFALCKVVSFVSLRSSGSTVAHLHGHTGALEGGDR